ncbi:MAG: UvrD-helicase domain-containing protein [Halanaerobiales bacterium]
MFLLYLIRSLLNLFVDEEKEYIDSEIQKYYHLFYNTGEYPLNRNQCEAVVKNRKYNQVIAAAGTGKTTVIAYRIKYLIEKGIEPERILAITYSRKAANEMEIRLLRQFDIKNVEVRTIHSLANKILQNESEENLSIIKPEQRKKIISTEFNRKIREDKIFQHYYYNFFRLNHRLDRKDYQEKSEIIDEMISSKYDILEDYLGFIDLAKKNNIQATGVKKLLDKNNQRQYFFGLSAIKLYEYYQEYLSKYNKIDFNDMLYRATNILKKNPERYYRNYDHMLVDEFQDVSLAQIQLIQQFFRKGSNMKLFCVGDDWQSIYSFQGSEPEYFINFEKYFGQATKTYLTDNYRCPTNILNAGNLLIAKNKNQIRKKVRANKNYDTKAVIHLLEKGHNYEDYLGSYTLVLVKKLLNSGSRPEDIMILCRYDTAVPYLDRVKKYLKKERIPYKGKANDCFYPVYGSEKAENAVSVFSIHQAKGCEADNVILLHAVAEDRYSFPQNERDNELLNPVKINQVNHLEEERRLFYVAITRSRKNLHILSQTNNISPFIKEIRPYIHVKKIIKSSLPPEYVNIKARVDTLWENHSEKIKQVGLLKDSDGKVMKFISWSNSNAPVLEKNIWYQIENMKVSHYNNKEQLVISSNTQVRCLHTNK